MERYTVRYRWVDAHGRVGCIVADEQGTAYLFWRGILQLRCAGPAAGARLARAVARHATPHPVPAAGSYTLDELRRLVAGAGSPCLALSPRRGHEQEGDDAVAGSRCRALSPRTDAAGVWGALPRHDGRGGRSWSIA